MHYNSKETFYSEKVIGKGAKYKLKCIQHDFPFM